MRDFLFFRLKNGQPCCALISEVAGSCLLTCLWKPDRYERCFVYSPRESRLAGHRERHHREPRLPQHLPDVAAPAAPRRCPRTAKVGVLCTLLLGLMFALIRNPSSLSSAPQQLTLAPFDPQSPELEVCLSLSRQYLYANDVIIVRTNSTFLQVFEVRK